MVIPSRIKFFSILAGSSCGYFSNQNCIASIPNLCGIFVYKFSTSKDTKIALESVDCSSFDKKSFVSLILLFTCFEYGCSSMSIKLLNL